MFDWLRFGRAQTAIYALAAFALLALVAWRAESLYVERDRVMKGAQTQAVTLAFGTANYIDRTIDVAVLMADDVRNHIKRLGGLEKIPSSDLQQFLTGKVNETMLHDYLAVVDPSGYPIALSDRPNAPRIDLSDRDWFKAVMQRGLKDYVGSTVFSRLGRRAIYTYSQRIDGDDGKAAGIVDVAIQASDVRPPNQRQDGEPQVQVWNGDGRLIAASFMAFDARGNAIAQKQPFKTTPALGTGFLKTGDPDLIVAYQRASDRSLIVTVSMRRSEILAGWHVRVRDSVAILVIAASILSMLVWFANSLLARDARRRVELEKAAAALSLAVAQRDTLLKEIHHRVKNNLQVTSSLIDMQARQFEDDAVRVAFKRTQQRLYAIGMVHDVLYGEQGVSIVDMRDYLTRLCNEVARANGTKERNIGMTLDIAPISLPAEQATSLGLCVSEVLVNAFKHAFPETGGGEIAIRLHETAGNIELTVRDNGLGIGPPEGNKSLGMRLIRSFASQLGGTFAFESDGGTTFRLNFVSARPHAVAAQ